MEQVANLIRHILEQNSRDFGFIWREGAKCELVLFGYLPSDGSLLAYLIRADIKETDIDVSVSKLDLVRTETACFFGSASDYFKTQLQEQMQAMQKYEPFNLLTRIIRNSERPDVGGYIQVALAGKDGACLPHVATPRPERGEYEADVIFLGRDVSEVGPVGDCPVGRVSVGPSLEQLLEMRKKAGY